MAGLRCYVVKTFVIVAVRGLASRTNSSRPFISHYGQQGDSSRGTSARRRTEFPSVLSWRSLHSLSYCDTAGRTWWPIL